MNEPIMYSLKFVDARTMDARQRRPAIEIVIAAGDYPAFYERLTGILSRKSEDACKYLGATTLWQMPENVANEVHTFGYGKCAYIEHAGEKLRIGVKLGRDPLLRRSALTLSFLTQALGSPAYCNVAEPWVFTLSIHCENSGYGHPVGGYVSKMAHAWLKAYAHEHFDRQKSLWGRVPLPEDVTRAMQSAWRTINRDNLHKYETELYGWVTLAGAFGLNCFGDACDLSLYPDGLCDDDDNQLQCHNLDTAEQMMTLIAGLATLAMIVEKDMS